ncbi:putative polyketide synthase [Seiridium cardinale]|uniref:Polyketide synthase n=1 Tax=Seiridium cardinale TaxID=138064 RepID=A0ABR2YAC1_9PEZI
MITSQPRPQKNEVLLFGPQALQFDRQYLEKLRKTIATDPDQRWMLQAIGELPRYWTALAKTLPDLAHTLRNERVVLDLRAWLMSEGDVEFPFGEAGNAVLTPLVVLHQLTQYWQYVQKKYGESQASGTTVDSQAELVATQQHGSETHSLGLCTGMLSSFAVSSAKSRLEFEKYGSVAVRLAMLIGAVVDAEESSNQALGQGKATSFATAWHNDKEEQDFRRILDSSFPDTYVSVRYDEARATVTTSEHTAGELLQQLRDAGITVAEVGLKGRFHNPDSETSRHADALVALCDGDATLQFAEPHELAFPSYTNAGDGASVSKKGESLHKLALQAILTQQSNWYATFKAINSSCIDGNDGARVVSFGPDRCVPPTFIKSLSPKIIHSSGLNHEEQQSHNSLLDPGLPFQNWDSACAKPLDHQAQHHRLARNDESIAVVGMSIKVAGADDLNEFSDLLRTGLSQHELIGDDRLMLDTLFREGDKDPERKWYGNFVRDPGAFDHKFFKRSPRESSTMDPQQRLFLQAAYQAVEQSGYFNETTRSDTRRNKEHVGVYLGACSGDWEHHAACHTANAFTATGNLKSFIPGKVSHYFGWTGPSIAYDTACSASAVAIHTACRNLLSGECTAALAGGVAMMSNFLWFQNLAGASFLSPTGQCKPFDESADGYCRGEGIACVFLKKMSDALADGNPILGCIPSTAVYQNQNCTPLFVPNSPSLSQLFTDVVQNAKLSPQDISLVEAHGTGTPVGDPAEYESIRMSLGGENRSDALTIGSVKGHIGHTEGASGVIALIKVILMMQGNYIPPQASFSKMSSHIKVTPEDHLEVATSLRSWNPKFKAALINNYGASGSNASMIVTQPPQGFDGLPTAPIRNFADSQSFPFSIAGLDGRAISSYAGKLLNLIRSHPDLRLADLSFQLNLQSNRRLSQSSIFTCRSMRELEDKLSKLSSQSDQPGSTISPAKPERPVILCFGGQVSTFVGLDEKLYDSISVLRHHLDRCDAVIQSLGHDTIYPDIYRRQPVKDTVKLQTMLFALQYSCAKSWMDCGLDDKVVAVVGHSFGELTALCISGVLSLKDAVKLVAGRARLVRDDWGPESGAMMAVDSDETLINEVLKESNANYGGEHKASIACFNGPRSFTLAGSVSAIDRIDATIANSARFSGIKHKRLNVTNAFHSSLVDPLMDNLELIGKELTFNAPFIPFERATATEHTGSLTPRFVPDHMRSPVCFNHALQRLSQKYSSAIFLEAGTQSTITLMASRALAHTAASSSSHFQALNITNDHGLDGLTDATTSLWKEGVSVSFWGHHHLQSHEYPPLLLPPYQFDKSTNHWLELKSPAKAVADAVASATARQVLDHQSHGLEDKTSQLWTFVGYTDSASKRPRFRINTDSACYKEYISGHLIAQTAPICPATLEVDMAVEALFSLHSDWKSTGLQPVVHDMVNHAPLCVDHSRVVWLDFQNKDEDSTQWLWKITSEDVGSPQNSQTHVDARIHIRASDDASYIAEFSRFERLVGHAKCLSMLSLDLNSGKSFDVLTGRNIYRTFSPVVDYGEPYRGVQAVVGGDDECAGLVHKRHAGQTWLDVLLSDNFSQVGGIFVNCMTDHSPTDMFIATGCELTMRSPRAATHQGQEGPDVWHVYARHTRQSEKVFITDVFVFNAASGVLTEVMMGIQYARVAKSSMAKMLTRLTKDESVLKNIVPTTHSKVTSVVGAIENQSPSAASPHHVATSSSEARTIKEEVPETAKSKRGSTKPKQPDITDDVRKVVANVSGIEEDEIALDSEMADFGIDSLMGMELAREVEVIFKCKLDQDELMEATSLRKFVVCISNALFGPVTDSSGSGDLSDEGDDKSWSSDSKGSTTATSVQEAHEVLPKANAVVSNGHGSTTAKSDLGPVHSNLELTQQDILDAFGEVKMLTDTNIKNFHLDNIDKVIIAATNRLSAALIVEAFDELGSPLRTAIAGEVIDPVPYLPKHGRLMDFIYTFLEYDARLLETDAESGRLIRTAIPAPRKSSAAILQDLLSSYPEFCVANKLTYYAGKHLAGVLNGTTDGIRVLFGSIEGRELVQDLYYNHTFNRMNYTQMRDAIAGVVKRIKPHLRHEPLKILEMGAGTGGTTHILAPFLHSLDIPVVYTFTDLSPSMVANARRKFGKQYSFMRFETHDIEKPPIDALKDQHIILASNAVHATHNLVQSLTNIRQALRPDGFLMILEMTEKAPFIDVIFGLLEGWWLFDDGRKHAIVTAEYWERELHASGFSHVDWTDGNLPENTFQKVMVAFASGPVRERLPKPAPTPDVAVTLPSALNVTSRMEQAESYITKYTSDFPHSKLSFTPRRANGQDLAEIGDAVVIVTGATGSLGAHTVAELAERPSVKCVVCMNRRTSSPVQTRQKDAFLSRGIELSAAGQAKLRIIDADSSKQQLGLPTDDYDWLRQHVTHIIHNAWPMSGTRPLGNFEPQFQTLRNLLTLASDIAARDPGNPIGFQLVSSIGVVGHSSERRVLETPVSMQSVLPIGYCEAKWVCERMLDETLHQHPEHFRTMVVRPGQIAGSKTSGFWNPIEHFAFLVKSAQALRAWPDFDGVLQWIPVNDVAGTMADLLHIENPHAPKPYHVYHIDNPIGQPWKEMSPVLADALGIPKDRIIPFRTWVRLVRHSPLHAETDNPAARLIDFLDGNFERMSCGGLILDTAHSQEHSKTMAHARPVTEEVARRYIVSWKKMGFLKP